MVRDRRATLVWALLLGCGFGTNSPGDNAGLGEGAGEDTSTGAAADGNGGSDQAEGNQGGTADGDVTGSLDDDDDDDDDDVTGSMDDDDDATTEGPGDTGDTGDSGGSSSTGMMGDDDDDDMADDPYGPCPGGSSEECTGEQVCLVGGAGLPSACAQPCDNAGECPAPPDGNATPYCSELASACVLLCGSGETCPATMSCIGGVACGHG